MTGPLPSDDYLDRVRRAEEMIAEAEDAYADMPEAERISRADQLIAAARETRAELEERSRQMGNSTGVTFGNKHRQMTLLLAGVIDTLRCKHFFRVPAQPALLIMSTRTQLCHACADKASRSRRHRPPVVVHDHQCDLCLGEPVEEFMSVTVQLGPVLMIGDVCEPCIDRLENA